jgi:hypothetical protein
MSVRNYPYWLGWPNQLFKPKRLRMDEMTDTNPPVPGEHWSDCAVHNGPALPVGPCDCGADDLQKQVESLTSRLEAADLADDLWHAAEVRGIAMWREAHPGKELNLPDAAQYTFWLIHELEETRQAAEVEANERRRAHARIAELEAILTPAPSKEGDRE